METSGALAVLFLLIGYFETSFLISGVDAEERRVVCYRRRWRDSDDILENIDPFLCTHLVYAFSHLDPQKGVLSADPHFDIAKGGFERAVGLKKISPGLKVMLSVWPRDGCMKGRPGRLAASALRFLRRWGFDGLDVPWHHDEPNYVRFLAEVRKMFEKEARRTGGERLLLTVTAPAMPKFINFTYLPDISRNVDWMNLLSYKIPGEHEKWTSHHAPLYALRGASKSDHTKTIDYMVSEYLRQGMSGSQLTLGVAAFGSSLRLSDPGRKGLGSPCTGLGPGPSLSSKKGFLPYQQICEKLSMEEGWEVEHVNASAQGPFAYRNNTWISYDDPQAVKMKGEYAMGRDLGGLMFWTVDYMDSKGQCGEGAFPLLRAARQALKMKTKPTRICNGELFSNSSKEENYLDSVIVHQDPHVIAEEHDSQKEPRTLDMNTEADRAGDSERREDVKSLRLGQPTGVLADIVGNITEASSASADKSEWRPTNRTLQSIPLPSPWAEAFANGSTVSARRNIIYQDYKIWIQNNFGTD